MILGHEAACRGAWLPEHLVFSKSSAVRRLAPAWLVLVAASPACQPATVEPPLPLLLLLLLPASPRGRGSAEAASSSATMFAEET